MNHVLAVDDSHVIRRLVEVSLDPLNMLVTTAESGGDACDRLLASRPDLLILDLGLNPNPYAQTDTTVEISQRIIMNHFTAKRLLAALSATIQRHEQAFGVLEIDVNKRVRKA